MSNTILVVAIIFVLESLGIKYLDQDAAILLVFGLLADFVSFLTRIEK